MNLIALLSGGKDSCFSILHSIIQGHKVVALLNLKPTRDEMDSFMFQSVGNELVEAISECIMNSNVDDQQNAENLPLYQATITNSKNKDLLYKETKDDEVEELFLTLKRAKQDIPDLQGVCSGAILSNYQRSRVENVCSRLNLTSIAYLWNANQELLLDNMIECGIQAVVVKVAAHGLTKNHLGLNLQELKPIVHDLKKFGVNVCGEGGEYETITLDSPIFKKRIEIVEQKVFIEDTFSPVCYMKISKFNLIQKNVCYSDIFNLKDIVSSCQLEQNEEEEEDVNDELMDLNLRTDVQDVSLATQTLLLELQKTLKKHSLSMDNVVFVNVFLKSMLDFCILNKEYENFFKNPPARSCVQTNLSSTVQMDVVFSNQVRRLKINSISYWAPATIGPYSQCCVADGLCFVAGQIGLIPETMQLAISFKEQAYLASRHVNRILSSQNKNNILSCICYVLNFENNEFLKTIYPECVIVMVEKLPRNAMIEFEVIGHNNSKYKFQINQKKGLKKIFSTKELKIPYTPCVRLENNWEVCLLNLFLD